MFKQKIQVSTLTLLTALAATSASAADQEEIILPSLGTESAKVMQGNQLRNQLLSAEERSSFQSRMQSASSHQERDAIRSEARTMIKERADAQGISLSENPRSGGHNGSQRRSGMGSGGGMGGGMGRGRF